MKSHIDDRPHICNRGPRVLCENDPSALRSLYKISPRLARETFVKAPPSHMHEISGKPRLRPTTVQDQGKADITGGGDLHIGVDDEIEGTLLGHRNPGETMWSERGHSPSGPVSQT